MPNGVLCGCILHPHQPTLSLLLDPRPSTDIIRDINDPEHPYSLEQLHVARLQQVWVDDRGGWVRVEFTPTIPHCSMSTLIGLSIRVKLARSLPPRFKIDVSIHPGSHAQEEQS